jgi:putative DNA primase/helicase
MTDSAITSRNPAVADLPEAAYAGLEAIAERIAIVEADQADQTAYQEGGNGNRKSDLEKRVIEYLAKVKPAVSGQSGHNTLYRAACVPVRFGLNDPETVCRILKDHYNERCEPPWSQSELRHKAQEACDKEKRRDLASGREKLARPSNNSKPNGRSKVNEAPNDPHRLARIIREKRCAINGVNTMIFYRGEYLRWSESAYHPVAEYEMTATQTRIIKEEFDRLNMSDLDAWHPKENAANGKPHPKPIVHQVTRKLVGNVDQALKGDIVVPGTEDPPMWLIADPPFPADDVLPTRNALVHLPSFVERKATAIVKPTPAFFSTYALDYDFDPRAPKPKRFHEFLETIWPGDQEQKDALQEWFGYLLTPDQSQQKIAFLLGPPRSGRGTIARLIRAMVGNHNVAGPTLSGLGGNFGLSTMIGKPVAVIADAKLSARSDAGAIVERLLNISGEDVVDIDRKNLPLWTGKLPTRLMMLANELPRLPDQAGALASRLLMFRFQKSFLGSEDRELDGRLRSELPGIVLWAIEGRRRLRERGKFLQPKPGESDLQQIKDFNSPVGAWVRERCKVGEKFKVPCDDAFSDWLEWCKVNNVARPGDKQTFGRNLRSVVPGLETNQYRLDDKDEKDRARAYIGIELTPRF